MPKEYPELVNSERPTSYSYDNRSLEEAGFKHRYALDYRNPIFKDVCKDLQSERVQYKVMTPPDRPAMRDIWVSNS